MNVSVVSSAALQPTLRPSFALDVIASGESLLQQLTDSGRTTWSAGPKTIFIDKQELILRTQNYQS